MSVKDDLIAAKALIDAPEKWGKGKGYDPPEGDCFCAATACSDVARLSQKYLPLPSFRRKIELWSALEAVMPEEWLAKAANEVAVLHDYNDAPETTHADIMALFDRAIEAAE